MNQGILTGPGYSALMPDGFTMLNGDPYSGTYWLLPPGSQAVGTPALVQIRPVHPFEVQMLLQNLYQFDNPIVAMMNAANMGLVGVTAVQPVRQLKLAQGTAHSREFDATTAFGFPARVLVVVIEGAMGTVEVVTMVNLYRWTEFIGPCLEFIGAINLSGGMPSPSPVRAVIDKRNTDHVEYHLVNPDHTTAPVTALPTTVGQTIVVNVDNSIKVGNISGIGVVVGNHSISNVNSKKQSARGKKKKGRNRDGG
jgi:hypothetical protein